MFARKVSQQISNKSGRRGISFLVNKPSHVKENQEIFLSRPDPTYVKKSSDRSVYYALWTVFGLGVAGSLRGEVNMSTGTGKKEE